MRRQKRWLVLPAMIGGAALLADGMITPPISITAAVEGLEKFNTSRHINDYIIYIVLGIIARFLFLQQFGTASIGKLFGPIMLVWFTMLAILGLLHIFLMIFPCMRAVSPSSMLFHLLKNNPNALMDTRCRFFFVLPGQKHCTAIWDTAEEAIFVSRGFL